MENRVVELDVRPQLRQGAEPLGIIMSTVKQLKGGEIFVLHATLKPVPLLKLMELRGYRNQCEQAAEEHWKVTFERKSK